MIRENYPEKICSCNPKTSCFQPFRMNIPSLAALKKELSYLDEKELSSLILELSKFTRDNKAFLYFKLNERTSLWTF